MSMQKHADGEEHEHEKAEPVAAVEPSEHEHDADEHKHEHAHTGTNHHGHDHHDHAGHSHSHDPLPVEQREVTAILVLTASIGGVRPNCWRRTDEEDQQGLSGTGRIADSRNVQPVRNVRRSVANSVVRA